MKKDEFGRHTVLGSRRGGVDRAGKTWHGKKSIASLFGPFPVEPRPRGVQQNTHGLHTRCLCLFPAGPLKDRHYILAAAGLRSRGPAEMDRRIE
jgi:hypothetical protein